MSVGEFLFKSTFLVIFFPKIISSSRLLKNSSDV